MASRLTTLIVVLIVAATFVAGIITRAQRDDQGPVDLIVYNGKVYAGEGKAFAEAIAVRGNKIVVVGSNRDVKRLRRPQTTVIDAHGGAVLPGFNDSHVHFLDGSMSAVELDLTGVGSIDEISERVRMHAEAHTDQAWILGHGWNERSFDKAAFTRAQLDAVSMDRPICLTSLDGSLAWVNSAALHLAGIARTTRSPKLGTIEKDAAGEPTGLLRGAAIDLVRASEPPPSHGDQLLALRSGIEEANRLGITSIQNAGGTPEEIALWDELRQEKALTVRTYQALAVRPDTNDSDIDKLEQTRSEYGDDPLLKTGSVEIVADNILVPDPKARARRVAATAGRLTVDNLKRLVAAFDRRGWQIWVHTNSEAGVNVALDAFEAAATANPAPARGRRHRIEHAQGVSAESLDRFDRLGVIASFQPVRAVELIPAGAESAVPISLLSAVSHGAWPWTSLADLGARLTFGSDWPAVRLDPRVGLRDAVTTPTTETSTAGVDAPPEPAEALPLPAAIDAYTTGGAYASFDEQRKGTLAPGMLADIAILSADIFSTPVDRLLDVRVDVTIFDGAVVFDRNAD